MSDTEATDVIHTGEVTVAAIEEINDVKVEDFELSFNDNLGHDRYVFDVRVSVDSDKYIATEGPDLDDYDMDVSDVNALLYVVEGSDKSLKECLNLIAEHSETLEELVFDSFE